MLSVMLCYYFVMYGLCLLHALHTALPYYCTNGVLYSLYHISARKYASSHPETNEFMAVLFFWFEGPSRHQRQAQKLILGPSPTTKTGLLFFNRTQSRFVMGLLTGHNTLRRHLHLMGLTNNPSCRRCGTEEETSVHILYECEALASLRHPSSGTQGILRSSLGAIWNLHKRTGLP